MDDSLSLEIANLAWLLVPGFVSCWVFYGLTSHPKPSQFERVIQALIFTLFIQVLAYPATWMLLKVGSHFSVRPFDDTSKDVLSLFLAIGVGICLAGFTNSDAIHRWFRKKGFSTRTSQPSEWCYVFSRQLGHVVLELYDGRRLIGYPKEWPVESGKGQFYLMDAAWILESETLLDLPTVDGILIPAEEVRWVEFMKTEGVESDAQ